MAGAAPALPADQRPVDPTPVHTDDLPPTPIRDRNIPASAWIEAPDGAPTPATTSPGPDGRTRPRPCTSGASGRWLLWRAGPAKGADARYVAIESADLDRTYEFRLFPDGSGEGVGPSGTVTPGSGRGRKTCATHRRTLTNPA